MIDEKPSLDEDLLIHFGVKGMHWGVRKEEESVGRATTPKSKDPNGRKPSADVKLSAHEKEVLRAAGVSERDSASFQAKYGSGTLSEEPPKRHLTPQQKKLLAGVAIAAGVAGAVYLANRQGLFSNNGGFVDPGPYVPHVPTKPHVPTPPPRDFSSFQREWAQYQQTARTRHGGYTKEMVDKLSTDRVHLSAGTIFRRISTEQESTIRSGGFYASHDDADVERYKAILPVFWKTWGKTANNGYIVNLKANADIKAPSPKETFELFKSMLDDPINVSNLPGAPAGAKLRDAWNNPFGDDDSFARAAFPHFAQAWAQDNHPATKHFFQKLKDLGYNAVVDMNDVGALAKQPMRLIDGSIFSIDGHEKLTREAIEVAQENIKSIVHALLGIEQEDRLLDSYLEKIDANMHTSFQKPPLDEDLLIHFGVKGMHWGVRKEEESVGRRSHERAKQIANENASTKEYLSVVQKLNAANEPKSKEEAAKNLADNYKKFSAKFEPSDEPAKEGLSPQQKALLKKVAIGTVAAAGIAAAVYYGKNYGNFTVGNADQIKQMAGKRVSLAQYSRNADLSRSKKWMSGNSYITKETFNRPEVTLPAGHQFHRISRAAESGFGKATYSVASKEEFNRYVGSFAPNIGYSGPTHHITWNTTKDFKVPNIRTVLETVKEVLQNEDDLPESMKTTEYAVKWYNSHSGGAWDSSRAENLFAALKQKGYHAIVDEMDYGVQGDLPLVIFDHSNLTSKIATPMTDAMKKAATSAITELNNRIL